MLLVSIDTSGRDGSVALCRGNQSSFEVLQLESIQGGTYSARLMPLIAEILTKQNVTKEKVEAFVVVSGPGSFTGLRVGIATVKGLCEVLQKPLVAVSMLEAVALARGPGSGEITVVQDAGRGEVYVGEFAVENPRSTKGRLNGGPGKLDGPSRIPTPPKEGGMGHPTPMLREYISKVEVFAAENAAKSTPMLATDSKVADALLAAGIGVQQVAPVRADEIGRIGLDKFLRGETTDPATLDANYIRRSDAEIFSPPKR